MIMIYYAYCCDLIYILECPNETNDDPDAKISQLDYSRALGNNEDIDRQYIKFMTRVQRGGANQVFFRCILLNCAVNVVVAL
jgi:hypothetical protein